MSSRQDALGRMLEARLRHVLMLERNMMALLPRVKQGDEAARQSYEWYMQMAKCIQLKDLQGLFKVTDPVEEQEGGFDGFDDG